MIKIQDLKSTFDNFINHNILVIGDVMIDSYLWGKAERISPEAPVPVVSVKERQQRLGGAANVALNIQSLGANPILCSVIGNDYKGNDFLQILADNNLSAEGIISSNERITTTKYRIIANNYHMLRVDEENDELLNKTDNELLIDKIKDIISTNQISAIIFEDYDKGVICEESINTIVEFANKKNIPTVVDPKKRNFAAYKNVTLFKPNLKELKEGLKLDNIEVDIEMLSNASEDLYAVLNNKYTLITLSEKGVFIRNNKTKQQQLIPAHIRNISDVSGAGDTVISVVALLIASGIDEFATASISNLAGGLVCEQVGVVSINKELLFEEAEKNYR
ncbi:MAG: bifunctional ADP-heptose synthase [Bacteroidota bacterium]